MFVQKIELSCTTSEGFLIYGKIQRNLMIKFQENTLTDVWREGWTDSIS